METLPEAPGVRPIASSLLRRYSIFSSGGLPPRGLHLFPHRQFACDSCSMCATKSGGGKVGPIYGVFMLDPRRGSPLKLGKRSQETRGAKLERASISGSHPDRRIVGTLIVNRAPNGSSVRAIRRRSCRAPSQCRARISAPGTSASHIHTHCRRF